MRRVDRVASPEVGNHFTCIAYVEHLSNINIKFRYRWQCIQIYDSADNASSWKNNGSLRHNAKTISKLTSTCLTTGQNSMTTLHHY
jgi:hypothetical protein